MRMQFKREFYIPKGAAKVQHKHSTAVAYLYGTLERPCAVMFSAKRNKPDQRYRYANEARRAQCVQDYFDSVQKSEAFRAELKTKRKAATRSYVVGDVLYTSWGYEQTNVDFYQVTALIGKTMIEVRPIAFFSTPTGCTFSNRMSGYVAPLPDTFVGDKRYRVRATDSCRIDDHYAWKHETGRKHYTSSYA